MTYPKHSQIHELPTNDTGRYDPLHNTALKFTHKTEKYVIYLQHSKINETHITQADLWSTLHLRQIYDLPTHNTVRFMNCPQQIYDQPTTDLWYTPTNLRSTHNTGLWYTSNTHLWPTNSTVKFMVCQWQPDLWFIPKESDLLSTCNTDLWSIINLS